LHSDYDQRYSYKFEDLRPDVVDDTIGEIMQSVRKINDFKIEVHRNFRQTPFTPLMTKEAKLQIERKVVEVLGDLYGSYT